MTNGGAGTVSFIDPATGQVEGDPINVGPIPNGIAAGEGYVWVGFGEGATSISRIQPGSRQVLTETIEIGRSPSSLAVGEGRVYVAAVVGDKVVAVEPTSGEVEFSAPKDALEFPSTVATGMGSVWVTDVNTDELVELAPETLEVEDRIDVGTSPAAIVVGEGYVWVANFDETITRVDPRRDNKTKTIPMGEDIGAIAVGEGYVWAAAPEANLVLRVDAATGEPIAAPIVVGKNPVGITYSDGSVWIVNQGDDTVSQLDLHPDENAGS